MSVINFFIAAFMFLAVLCGIIILLCVIMFGLALFDYLCDTNIKDNLVKQLGPRKKLRGIRKNVQDFVYKNDRPSKEDLVAASDEDYKRYLYAGKITPEKTFELELQTKEDFNNKVHNEIEKIFEDGN